MDTVALILKLGIAGLMICMGYIMVRLVQLGRQARRTHDEMDRFEHRTMFPNLVYSSGLLVGLVLLLKMVRGSGVQSDTLASVHQGFAFGFAILVTVIGTWFTGNKSTKMHGPLAYILSLVFVGMFITGSIRLWYA